MARTYYLRNTNLDPVCNVAGPRDLSTDVGVGPAEVFMGTTSGSFVEVATFDMNIAGERPSSGVHNVDLNISSVLDPGEVEGRVRLRAVAPHCGVLASSAYSSTITDVGVLVAMLDLAWPEEANRIRLSFELRKLAGVGSKVIGVMTQDLLSFVQAPFVGPGHPPPAFRPLTSDIVRATVRPAGVGSSSQWVPTGAAAGWQAMGDNSMGTFITGAPGALDFYAIQHDYSFQRIAAISVGVLADEASINSLVPKLKFAGVVRQHTELSAEPVPVGLQEAVRALFPVDGYGSIEIGVENVGGVSLKAYSLWAELDIVRSRGRIRGV